MTWTAIKVAAAVAACALCAFGGYRYAAALYGKDIAELRGDYAARAAALEEKYREKERQGAEAISAAWEERDRAMADAVDLRGDLERVRREGDALERGDKRISGRNAADQSVFGFCYTKHKFDPSFSL